MLYYLPLEEYKERYASWSRAKTGWLEKAWHDRFVRYRRIDGDLKLQTNSTPITTGVAVDAFRRTNYCFSQISELLKYAENKLISSDDVIYFDDMWHPGIESLPYVFSLQNINPKIYCFCHAQSVDEFDFTHRMKYWMRDYEKCLGKFLSGIFVNCNILRELLLAGGVSSPDKIKVIGHIFNSDEVMFRMPADYLGMMKYKQPEVVRQNQVVFSSRWDEEKNPWFFLSIAKQVIKERPNSKFVICTSSPNLRSNNPVLLEELKAVLREYPNNVILKQGLSKEEYYNELAHSKIQINTSSQDFVSFVLLEASVAGCYPIYPYFRSFPEVLNYESKFMYQHLKLEAAVNQVIKILDRNDLWTKEEIESRSWIHKRHDKSVQRMLHHMGLMKCPEELVPYPERSSLTDGKKNTY